MFDSDHGGAVKAQLSAELVGYCRPGACSGYSISGGIGCHLYQLDATGTVGKQEVTTELTAFEIAACGQ